MQLLLPQMVIGFAFPFVAVPIMDMSVGFLSPKDLPAGTGQLNFVRTLSAAIGTAVSVAIWIDAISGAKATLAGELHNPDQAIALLQSGGFSDDQATHLLDLAVQGQSVMLGTNHTFLFIGLTLLVAAAVVWLAPKPPRHSAGTRKRVAMH